jgi:hypothetical protein
VQIRASKHFFSKVNHLAKKQFLTPATGQSISRLFQALLVARRVARPLETAAASHHPFSFGCDAAFATGGLDLLTDSSFDGRNASPEHQTCLVLKF